MKYEHRYTDFWGRKIYKDEDGHCFVAVDGELHTMTGIGEPVHPINEPEPIGKQNERT